MLQQIKPDAILRQSVTYAKHAYLVTLCSILTLAEQRVRSRELILKN